MSPTYYDDEVTQAVDKRVGDGQQNFMQRIERHPNSARFHEILKGLGELHDRKQADYGRGGDPFANVRASSDFGVPAWVGAMIRLNDKVKRLQSLSRKGKLYNESAVDSFKDIAVYAVIALVLYEQECGAQGEQTQQYQEMNKKQPGGLYGGTKELRGYDDGGVVGRGTEAPKPVSHF